MDNQVLSPSKLVLLLRIQRYYDDIHQPLMYISPWDLVADQLGVSDEIIVVMDRNKHARLSSVLNLVTLTNQSIGVVCPIWSISRITVIFNMGADFFNCHSPCCKFSYIKNQASQLAESGIQVLVGKAAFAATVHLFCGCFIIQSSSMWFYGMQFSDALLHTED